MSRSSRPRAGLGALASLVAALAITPGSAHAQGSGAADAATPAPAPGWVTDALRVAQDFVAANDLSLKGDTKAALALYEALLAQGVRSEDLYFNLGNTYAQAGRLVDAAIAFERALRLAPGDADVRANLVLVRERLAARSGEKLALGEGSGQVVLADVLEPLVASLPLAVFGWMTGVANVALFALALLRRRATTDASRRRLTLAATLAGAVVATGLAVVGAHLVVARDPRAVVVETTDLKEGPRSTYKSSGRAGAGERVRVAEEDAGFAKVLRQDGTSGWVPVKALERL